MDQTTIQKGMHAVGWAVVTYIRWFPRVRTNYRLAARLFLAGLPLGALAAIKSAAYAYSWRSWAAAEIDTLVQDEISRRGGK